MKNKLIFLWNSIIGGCKKKVYVSLIRSMVIICAVSTFASITPAGGTAGNRGRAMSRSPRSGSRTKSPQPQVTATPQQATQRVVALTPAQLWQTITYINTAEVPWSMEVQQEYNAIEGQLTPDQKNLIIAEYNKKLASQPGGASYINQESGPVGPSFALENVGVAAQLVGAQAAKKAQSYYDWAKEKIYNTFAGTYASSMGAAKYIAPAVLGFATGPAGWFAGATAAMITGGSALAIWGLSNIMDRANFIALSGGHATTASWLKALKAQLIFILNDKAAYPYLSARQEALQNQEVYPSATDSTGTVKQAYDAVFQMNTNDMTRMQKDPILKAKEQKFMQNVEEIRNNANYSKINNDQYIAYLEQGNELSKAQALVSEYNRALNRKAVIEAIQKHTADQQAKRLKEINSYSIPSKPTVESLLGDQ